MNSTLLYDRNIKPPSIIPNRTKERALNIFGIENMYKVGSHVFQKTDEPLLSFEPLSVPIRANLGFANHSVTEQLLIRFLPIVFSSF